MILSNHFIIFFFSSFLDAITAIFGARFRRRMYASQGDIDVIVDEKLYFMETS